MIIIIIIIIMKNELFISLWKYVHNLQIYLKKKYAVYNTKERFRKYIPCVSDAIISSSTIPLDTVQYFKLSHTKKK